jgi:phospholipid N-methyltransferase
MPGTELQPTNASQFGRFFRSWIQDPLSIGAVAPSGRLLARLMVRDLRGDSRVVELGSGTGTVTQAIVDRGVKANNLCLIEQHAQFIDILRGRFPGALTVKADATDLNGQLAAWSGSVDFVVSGLPLILFTSARKRILLTQAFDLLNEQGSFHQFTYAARCPVGKSLLAELGLKATRLGVAAFNFPPAFVYRFERIR